MIKMLFVFLSVAAHAQTPAPAVLPDDKIEHTTDAYAGKGFRGERYSLKSARDCWILVSTSQKDAHSEWRLRIQDNCTGPIPESKKLEMIDQLLTEVFKTHEPSSLTGLSTGHLKSWTPKIVDAYLIEPSEPLPSYKRFAEIFNENDIGREFLSPFEKRGAYLQLDSIEKMFRSFAKEVPLATKRPELLKRKTTIPWGAGSYWFELRSKDERECLAKKGVWGGHKPAKGRVMGCNLPAPDADKACAKGEDCVSGFCSATKNCGARMTMRGCGFYRGQSQLMCVD